jgi:hypothetical protein
MVVRRSCINTRRRAKIVNHVNTAKTSSEKNEYKVDLQRLHEVEEVSNNRTIYTVSVSRRQRSRYQLSLVLGKLQWHQLLILPGPIMILSGTNSSPTIPWTNN